MNSAALLYILFEEHVFSKEKDKSPCINANGNPINIRHELSGSQSWSSIIFPLF